MERQESLRKRHWSVGLAKSLFGFFSIILQKNPNRFLANLILPISFPSDGIWSNCFVLTESEVRLHHFYSPHNIKCMAEVSTLQSIRFNIIKKNILKYYYLVLVMFYIMLCLILKHYLLTSNIIVILGSHFKAHLIWWYFMKWEQMKTTSLSCIVFHN